MKLDLGIEEELWKEENNFRFHELRSILSDEK